MVDAWSFRIFSTLKNVDYLLTLLIFRRPIGNQTVFWTRTQLSYSAKSFFLPHQRLTLNRMFLTCSSTFRDCIASNVLYYAGIGL